MCDCVKYKDFFAECNFDDVSLLKEELSINEDNGRIPNGMSPEDYQIFKNTTFATKNDRIKYLRNYRLGKHQCIYCGNQARLNPDGTYQIYCDKCSEKDKLRLQLRAQSRKSSGICVRCGNEAVLNSDGTYQILCNQCAEKHNLRAQSIHKSRKSSGLCAKCGKEAIKKPDGTYQIRCDKCAEKNKLGIQLKTQSRKKEAVKYKGGKCMHCGYKKSIVAMDFHHIDPSQKDKNWKTLRKHSLEQLKNELDKCDLLCKNCHLTVHHKREKPNNRSKNKEFKKLACLDYKNTIECTKCHKTGVLDIFQFHHTHSKDPNFENFFSWREWSVPVNWKIEYEKTGKLPERIQNELDKCVVLCANCHAEEHWDPETGDTTAEFDKEIPKEECIDDICKHSHT